MPPKGASGVKMGDGTLGIILSIIGAVIGGVGTIFGVVSTQYKSVIEELRKQISDLRAQLKMASEQIENKQEAIDELYGLQAECETDSAELYGWISLAYNWISRHADDPKDAVPTPPARKDRRVDRAEYLRRRAEQNARLAVAAIRTAEKKLDESGVLKKAPNNSSNNPSG
jgi:DNA repair exonuclease SbcCD ATPase subunit